MGQIHSVQKCTWVAQMPFCLTKVHLDQIHPHIPLYEAQLSYLLNKVSLCDRQNYPLWLTIVSL